MTIASAFNDIAVAQGGSAATTGSIAGAIDALNDALAGSDQQAASTIEGAVRLLGEHIGGGGSPTARVWVTEGTEELEGKVGLNGAELESVATTEVDGAPAFGFDVPAGSVVQYRVPDGKMMSASTGVYIYESVEDMEALGQSMLEATGYISACPATVGASLLWVDLA